MGTTLSSQALPQMTTPDAPAQSQDWPEVRHSILNRLNCIKLSVTVLKRVHEHDPALLAELLQDIEQAADEINTIVRQVNRP